MRREDSSKNLVSQAYNKEFGANFRLFVNFFVYWIILRNATKALYALKGI
jgi:hypothetical protein